MGSTMSVSLAAQLFLFLIVIVILFQLALAFGAPWGHLAMGGKFPGQFPPNMRIAAAIQMVILALLGVVVLIRAELILPDWFALSTSAIWVVVAFSALSAVLNIITPSKWERLIWAPVTLLLLITSIIVAIS